MYSFYNHFTAVIEDKNETMGERENEITERQVASHTIATVAYLSAIHSRTCFYRFRDILRLIFFLGGEEGRFLKVKYSLGRSQVMGEKSSVSNKVFKFAEEQNIKHPYRCVPYLNQESIYTAHKN